jgi:epoxyqueuosine reductase
MQCETFAPLRQLPFITHAFTLRTNEDTKADEFEGRVLTALGFPSNRCASAEQTHGDGVAVVFDPTGERVPMVVPPTYVSYTPRTESVQAVLADWFQHEGYRLAKPQLPLKTLAVRSGLADYGRNDICYVSGMGSFLQLVGAFSDLPCDGDPWREPKALDRCESCVACLRHCPTGAIANDRFLLRAERCLTYHNEAAGDFPSWIDPSWHHCLIGCLRCQAACPEDRAVLAWLEDRAEFSEQETTLFIQRVPLDRLPAETVAKLNSLEINEDYRLLCRNLSMIIGRKSCGSEAL